MIKILVTVAGCLVLGGCTGLNTDFHRDQEVVIEEGQEQAQNNLSRPTVCKEKQCIRVEIADTPDARTQGLMFRTEMDRDSGMLFVFDKEEVYSFWMKNTLIPLDMFG